MTTRVLAGATGSVAARGSLDSDRCRCGSRSILPPLPLDGFGRPTVEVLLRTGGGDWDGWFDDFTSGESGEFDGSRDSVSLSCSPCLNKTFLMSLSNCLRSWLRAALSMTQSGGNNSGGADALRPDCLTFPGSIDALTFPVYCSLTIEARSLTLLETS